MVKTIGWVMGTLFSYVLVIITITAIFVLAAACLPGCSSFQSKRYFIQTSKGSYCLTGTLTYRDNMSVHFTTTDGGEYMFTAPFQYSAHAPKAESVCPITATELY